jgi:hypothetical protein
LAGIRLFLAAYLHGLQVFYWLVYRPNLVRRAAVLGLVVLLAWHVALEMVFFRNVAALGVVIWPCGSSRGPLIR